MKLTTKTTILSLALTIAVCAIPNLAFAGVESDPNLAKLEVKFFHNNFAKDDADARLSRLEKLVFGEGKSGDTTTRLNNLVGAVPNLGAPADNATAQGPDGAGSDEAGAQNSSSGRSASSNPDTDIADREKQITDGSQYPAVTAMEKKVLGKNYSTEPIVKRLERLEIKIYGKPVEISDLSDRVDRLKSSTGIDLARTPPAGSDWSDDDDAPTVGSSQLNYVPERRPAAPSYNPDNDPMFNGRNANAPSRSSNGSAWSGGGGDMTSSGSGSYGGGSSYGGGVAPRDPGGYKPGGTYGYTPPRKVASSLPPTASGIPQTAPDVVRSAGVPPTAIGLSQQVALLENELFRKSFAGEPIPARLTRLEGTVFPGDRSPSNTALPDRVQRLLSAVPISTPGASVPRLAQTGVPQVAPDYEDNGPMPAPARGPSGISKIINGLGSLIMGAPMGAYPMTSNLIQDPTSGLLIDQLTGNVIDPVTGQVLRQGAGGAAGYGGGAYNGFNSGLSPIGSPYGMGASNMRFGFGGSGIRFGGGGMGMGGSGMGMGSGMGLWP